MRGGEVYRAKCPWCRGYGPKQRSEKRAIAVIKVHMKRADHPRRNKYLVHDAIKRSVVEVV